MPKATAWRGLAAAIVGMSLFLGAGPVAAQTVGKVWLIKEKAFEREDVGSVWDDLFIDDNIVSDQWVRTPTDAALHVNFVDGTNLRLGANSEVKIDRYVYDPSRKGASQVSLSLAKGMFRIITGKLDNYSLKTPSATLGIRGTDILIAYLPSLGTVVQVNSGLLKLTACTTFGSNVPFNTACQGASSVTLIQGQSAGVAPTSTQVAMGAAFPIDDPGLNDDAGLLGIETGAGGRRGGPRLGRFNPFGELSNLLQQLPDTDPTVSQTEPSLDE